MWQIIRKQTRPDPTVNFFTMANNMLVSNDFKRYWYETYTITDKLIFVSTEISQDELELTMTMIWDSQDSVNQMLSDPVCIENLLSIKDAYLAKNNMQEILVSAVEV